MSSTAPMPPIAALPATPREPAAPRRDDPHDRRGLDPDEARRRRAAEGPNALAGEPPTPAWRRLLAQFESPLVLLLCGACALAVALGEAADAIAIGVILVVDAVFGFVQEHRAERAIAELSRLTAPRAQVVRGGVRELIAAEDVVTGDLLVLEAGDLVAADARLVEAHELLVNEAALTGESVASDKRASPPSAADAPLAERHDQVFMGTSVARGTGLARVTSTGMATEIGRIAHLLAATERTATPLQERLAAVGKALLIACLGIVLVVALLGVARGEPPLDILLSAASLAVAAVPEGLPAIVTIALAIGVRRMALRNVLVRRLSAVETLGCATVICSDKTGTLTTGVMSVREVWGAERRGLLEGGEQRLVLEAAAACCDAALPPPGDAAQGVGDPTELALLAAARALGVERDELERDRPRRATEPFDAETKRMTVHRADGICYMKGAPEAVLACVAPVARAAVAADVLAANAAMAARGLRVLAVATGPSADAVAIVGLVGLLDPPRTEAIAAVAAARGAGVKTVMITGDQAGTARAIAGELGLVGPGEDPADAVHARATPEDKLRIVHRWKAAGAVVAMTGDGVNDAPALREAHIGIAMGRTGTEVTRAASDMVLADDNFASIVAAVREGRGIFDNIRKTLVYLLAGNASELLLMLGAGLIGWPVPLLPLQLLWVNLVTDGLPALGLVLDPAPDDALDHPPRDPREPMLGRRQWWEIGLIALLEGGLVLAAYGVVLAAEDLDHARAMAFATLVSCELLRAFAVQGGHDAALLRRALRNLRIVAIIGVSLLLQVLIATLPPARDLFHIATLSAVDLLAALGLGLVPMTAVELSRRHARSARRPPRP